MNSAGCILVTPRSVTRHGHPSLNRLREAGYDIVLAPAGRQPREDELTELLADCVGMIAGAEPITSRVLASAPKLRAISRNGTGVDNIDLPAAGARRVTVLRAEGANARGVAELTLALMLALARDLPRSDASLKAGEWNPSLGIELEGKVLGLIGCGRIGRLVAQFAAALGMQVMGYDPLAGADLAAQAGIRLAGLDVVFREADFLSLHCPPRSDGAPVVDAAALQRTKRGVFIINTARFRLLNPAAILAGLEDGLVGGLALDVFPEEPPQDLHLARHPRVITSPHIGGLTKESVDRAMHQAVDNLIRELAQTPADSTSGRG